MSAYGSKCEYGLQDGNGNCCGIFTVRIPPGKVAFWRARLLFQSALMDQVIGNGE